MNGFSWQIFAGVQILFWIGFASGYNIRKQNENEGAGND